MKALFITNGHGEAAIAARIARELRAVDAVDAEHFPLVGKGFGGEAFQEVGPRAVMPSGGLVAMGNVAAFGRDVRAGFLTLFVAQRRFLRDARGRYAVAIAVGDVYALAMARIARLPTIFIGTAKSDYVAPYGWLERRIMSRAARIFVRDDVTARGLAAHGLHAEAANVIVDLGIAERDIAYAWPPGERIVLLPGSRRDAYGDAVLLAHVVRILAEQRTVHAALSVARSLDVDRLAAWLHADGWTVERRDGPEPFVASVQGKPLLTAWSGELGVLFDDATLVLGQAGTANEAAAARGLPVVALETRLSGRDGWYRMRQARLLGAALDVVPGDPHAAAAAVARLLDDLARRSEMGTIGRARMGPPGAARRIAEAIACAIRDAR